MLHQSAGEVVAALKAEEAGKDIERFGAGRQRVSLLVGHHLQAVLDPAQEVISHSQLIARGGIDPAIGGERGKRCDRTMSTQLGMAAPGYKLLCLHKKFDLADAAAAELDVVTLDRDLAVAAIGMDLPLHFVNVGDRRVVEISSPNKRREVAHKFIARFEIAGAGPRLDQRRALPVLTAALVIIERRVRRDRDLGR